MNLSIAFIGKLIADFLLGELQMNKHPWQKKRERFFEHVQHCFYCGRALTIEHTAAGNRPSNFATLDHIFCKRHPFRGKYPNVFVMACPKCNSKHAGLEGAAEEELLIERSAEVIGQLYEPQNAIYRTLCADFFS